MTRWRHARKDPKKTWCLCLHNVSHHEHLGYRKLQGMIVVTIRGRCDRDSCECIRMRPITRAHRDSLAKRRADVTAGA